MYAYSRLLKQNPEERTAAGAITSLPAKGQKSDPLKHADIPAQIKHRNRRISSSRLARQMERAGGQTTEKGRHYAAILEERGVNPNLQKENPVMARLSNNSLYKSAMWSAFSSELEKLAIAGANQPIYGNLANDPLLDRKQNLKSTGATNLAAATPGAAVGAGLGGLFGASMGKGFGSSLKSGVAGAALMGLGGGLYTLNKARQDPLAATYKGSLGAMPPPTRIS